MAIRDTVSSALCVFHFLVRYLGWTYTHSVPGQGSTIMYVRFNEDWVRQGDGQP